MDTFRNMYQEVVEKKASGEAFSRMKKALNRMEELEAQVGNGPQLTTLLTGEDLFIEFSTAYSEVLSEMARKEYQSVEGDEKLFQNTLAAYENSIKELEGKAHSKELIKPLEDILELGKSGISYPVFLRLCEEKGLNNALEGNLVVREVIIGDIDFARSMHLPLEGEMNQEILEKFDELSSKSKFKPPDSFEFSLESEKIQWKYAPLLEKWKRTTHLWGKMLEYMVDWVDAYTSFAPQDYRWADRRGRAYTMKNIKRTRECNPGLFKAREKLFYKYFQLSWEDIFTHPTFRNEQEAGRVAYSQDSLELIKSAYMYCEPFNNPPQELINKAETIHARASGKRDFNFF